MHSVRTVPNMENYAFEEKCCLGGPANSFAVRKPEKEIQRKTISEKTVKRGCIVEKQGDRSSDTKIIDQTRCRKEAYQKNWDRILQTSNVCDEDGLHRGVPIRPKKYNRPSAKLDVMQITKGNPKPNILASLDGAYAISRWPMRREKRCEHKCQERRREKIMKSVINKNINREEK